MATPKTQRYSQGRGSVICNCKKCGTEFSVWLSTAAKGKGQCCSKACANEMRTGKPAPKSKTRSDKKPRKSYVCQWCGKVFAEDRARSKPLQYCSNKCRGLSSRRGGKEHPRRKHAAELHQWTRAVILRDRACVRCGARDNLQAHHVKSYARHPEVRLDVSNGVALCAVCHHTQHPTHRLNFYLRRAGQTIQRCVVCEGEYLPHKKTQRTCSPRCGLALRYGDG